MDVAIFVQIHVIATYHEMAVNHRHLLALIVRTTLE